MTRWRKALVCLSLATLAACGGGEQVTEYAVTQNYESGEAVLTLKVDRNSISVADEIELTLEAVAAEGSNFEFPDIADTLGEFTVVGRRDGEPRLIEGNKVRHSRTVQLEPFLPGDYEIPALTARFGEDVTIETEPVTVTVQSVLPPEAGENPEIKEIAPPVSLQRAWWWLWIVGAAVVAVVALWYFWWRRRKSAEEAELLPQPHEIALRELRDLMAQDLIAKGHAKLLYLRLSAILRHYIEGRFGLLAPEHTTEEFLYEVRDDARFSDSQKQLLREFLEHCDMVKFAEYQPARDEIDDTINTCAQFIAETKPVKDEPAVAAVGGGGG